MKLVVRIIVFLPHKKPYCAIYRWVHNGKFNLTQSAFLRFIQKVHNVFLARYDVLKVCKLVLDKMIPKLPNFDFFGYLRR